MCFRSLSNRFSVIFYGQKAAKEIHKFNTCPTIFTILEQIFKLGNQVPVVVGITGWQKTDRFEFGVNPFK